MSALEIRELRVGLPGHARPLLSGVDLVVAPGEIVGVVGESGSGKSTTARAALGLFPGTARVTGSVRVGGTEVVGAPPAALRDVRLTRAAMIHQTPSAAMNPVRTIGSFATEQLTVARGMDRHAAEALIVDLLASVGLADPERLLRRRPHELSGGMLQRVVIAAALAAEPTLLLADEATSALDVSTQADIVALLLRLRSERGLGVVFITHDLTLAAAICDRVAVMYAGRIVEVGPATEVFAAPVHPYTAALRDSVPELGGHRPLRPIPGQPPSVGERLVGCPFAPRCPHAAEPCVTWEPELLPTPHGGAACVRAAGPLAVVGERTGEDR